MDSAQHTLLKAIEEFGAVCRFELPEYETDSAYDACIENPQEDDEEFSESHAAALEAVCSILPQLSSSDQALVVKLLALTDASAHWRARDFAYECFILIPKQSR